MGDNNESIIGVEVKELKTFPDDRGFFRELVRYNDPFFVTSEPADRSNFAQLSHSKMAMNTIKAWHYHHKQTDWWYCPIGVLHTVLFDLREESETYQRKMEFIIGDSSVNPEAQSIVIKIPPGVAHGCRVLTDFAHLFYITNETYNPDDEGRHPYNSPIVHHDWGQGNWIVVERDTKPFVPKPERIKL